MIRLSVENRPSKKPCNTNVSFMKPYRKISFPQPSPRQSSSCYSEYLAGMLCFRLQRSLGQSTSGYSDYLTFMLSHTTIPGAITFMVFRILDCYAVIYVFCLQGEVVRHKMQLEGCFDRDSGCQRPF